MNRCFIRPFTALALALLAITPTASAESAEDFEGYDFGQVVTEMEASIHPLQRELSSSFLAFVRSVEGAQDLLAEGRTREAIEACVAAIDGVIETRSRVLDPMWDGQTYLTEQIAQVRTRLAQAVEAAGQTPDQLAPATEQALDELAAKIDQEQDELRRSRLVMQYRTVRDLARIRRMAKQLSPDQRRLWQQVLTVLEEAALAHQQVLLSTEVLFAQFEATRANLDSYATLLQTVDGAERLLAMIGGLGETGAALSSFAQNMQALQDRLASFNEAVDQTLRVRVAELDAELDAAAAADPELRSPTIDDELADRIERVRDADRR